MAGSHCTASSPCMFNSLQCSSWGYCVCIDGFVSNGLGECLPTKRSPMTLTASKRSAECTTSSECPDGLECTAGSCSCPSGAQLRNGRCTARNSDVRGAFGMKCLKSSECKTNLICTEQRCSCPRGTYELNGKCVHHQTSVPPGSWCDENMGVMCSGGSRCYQNSCVCPYGHRISALECVPATNVLPGGPCMNDAMCVDGSKCVIGKCICVSGVTIDGRACQLGSTDRSKRSLPGQHTATQRRLDDTVHNRQLNDIRPCPSDGSCQLPDCYCSRSGMEIPGGYEAIEVPQMVILTFDDPVTDRSIKIFKSLFSGRFRNPNGCPIKATFFVSHEWNNYDQTQWLMSNGHEIAVRSMTGDALGDASSERWHAEVMGMRDALRLFSYVPNDEIVGARAPHLKIAGDKQFSTLKSSGFTYDSTMSFSGGPFWPQTFDFALAWGCSQAGCPRISHPGLWEIPISRITRGDSREDHITLKDALRVGDLPADIANMLEDNFQRHYQSNRAPFVIAISTDYLTSLQDNGAVNALEMFISKVLQNSDMYIVSASQALQWLQLPTRLSKIHNFTAWQCPLRTRDHVLPCENPSTCAFTSDRGVAHTFRVCGSCPRAYPRLGDPTGTGNVTLVN
ncbi:unnamed protein product [Toxocara canis]|uniref:EB domain-containing protein n=1 Tax=Toxocara canis TaxID=6265 RepID=A0A3P7G7Z2_TOXCA|nr:unnamed protein product [Toxocara canis]